MLIADKIRMHGKCTVIARKVTPRVEYLEKLFLKETEENTRILTDDDRRYLKKMETQRYEDHNVITENGIDRMCGLFSRSIGVNVNTQADDRAGISNSNDCYVAFDVPTTSPPISVPAAWTNRGDALFPEIIGFGSSDATRLSTMTALVLPFSETYFNTYNNSDGGHNRIAEAIAPGSGFDFDDNHIARYVANYSAGDINDLDGTIREVGLFTPHILTGMYWCDLDNLVAFDNYGTGASAETPNKFWSILNIVGGMGANYAGVGWRPFMFTYSMGMPQTGSNNSVFVSRGSQTIQLPNILYGLPYFAPGHPQTPKYLIISFTPHRESQPVIGGTSTFGNDYTPQFEPNYMVATRALPIEFVKNANISLTVIWQIFYSRG